MKKINKKKMLLRKGLFAGMFGILILFLCCAKNQDDEDFLKKHKTTPPDKVPTVGLDVCTTCHTGQVSQWLVGAHANIGPDNYGNPSYAAIDDPLCFACHDPLGDGYLLVAGFTGNVPRPVIGCESCHGGGANHFGIGEIPFDKPNYKQCGQCHNIDRPLDHSAVFEQKHAVVPDDIRLNTGDTPEELYFVKKKGQESCRGCHNAHTTDMSIPVQYAQSGHGDTLAEAWIHYDWKHSGRGACQRCHTSTGMKNYADCYRNTDCDPASDYDPADNDFSHLMGNESGDRIDGNDQLESLYCWGCHTDTNGTLRDPGAVTPSYVDMAGNEFTFPNVYGSNICMLCHIGRSGGGAIINSTDDFSDKGFSNSHYLAAGAVLFAANGYEYTGLDYANIGTYEHDLIGSNDAPGTGNNGPCAGCHMETPEGHLFMPVKEDVTGVITEVTSTICGNCHSGVDTISPSTLEQEADDFANSLEALKVQLANRDFHFEPNYPYFFTIPDGGRDDSVSNWLTDTDGDTSPNPDSGKQNMGAAYNYNMLLHEHGAFSHNSYYTKRLIYDSIDWLDDFNLNDSVQATLNALDLGTHPYKPEACNYLLGDNTCASGTRP